MDRLTRHSWTVYTCVMFLFCVQVDIHRNMIVCSVMSVLSMALRRLLAALYEAVMQVHARSTRITHTTALYHRVSPQC